MSDFLMMEVYGEASTERRWPKGYLSKPPNLVSYRDRDLYLSLSLSLTLSLGLSFFVRPL
jgi:hypothetical protein